MATDHLKIHPIIRQHLTRHSITSDGVLSDFLQPTLRSLPIPSLFADIDKAVELVAQALKEKHDILIWGDYDVDGITATALLVLFFRQLGVDVSYHIPDRLTEGYGLNGGTLLEKAKTMAPEKLLITVDCGISNYDEIRLAQHAGFKVIITDHHHVSSNNLPADATINPRQKGCDFPCKDLAGVGVAFYLAAAVRAILGKDNSDHIDICHINMKSFLGLVAIGTIADVMPLTRVNRLLVKGGFESIGSGALHGINAIFAEMGVPATQISSERVSFQIAPAINAAGRLGVPLVPLEMLISESPHISKKMAAKLVQLNKERKKISAHDLDIALGSISIHLIERDKCIIMIGDFHDGVLGITASRLAERFHVPVLICCHDRHTTGKIKGSGRAPVGFDLYNALKACDNFLLAFGGHEAAAGFSLAADSFSAFKQAFEQYTLMNTSEDAHEDRAGNSEYLELALSEALNPVLLENILQLEPVGEGNPKPIFIDSKVRFVSYSRFGGNKEHMRGMVRGKYQNIPVIGFGLGDKFADVDTGTDCTIIYSHCLDHYKGQSRWRIRVENISQ